MACVQPIVASYSDAVKKSLPGIPNISIPVLTCRSQSRTPSPVKDLQPSFFAPIKRSSTNTSAKKNPNPIEQSKKSNRVSGGDNLTQVWQLEEFCKQIDQLVEDNSGRCSHCNAEINDHSDEYCSDCRLERARKNHSPSPSSSLSGISVYDTYGSSRIKRRILNKGDVSEAEEEEQDGDEDTNTNALPPSIIFRSAKRQDDSCDTNGENVDRYESETDEESFTVIAKQQSVTSCASSSSDDDYQSVQDETDDNTSDEEDEVIQSNEDGSSSEEDGQCEDDIPPRPTRLARQEAVGTYPSREYISKISGYSSLGACGGHSESENSVSIYPDISYYYSNDVKSEMAEKEDCFIPGDRPDNTSSTYCFPGRAAKDIEDVVNFWENDFQDDDVMIPSMGSWEKKGILPDPNQDYLDFKKYLAYKKLYQKWIDCSKSHERWDEKYWGHSLLRILRTKIHFNKARLCSCCCSAFSADGQVKDLSHLFQQDSCPSDSSSSRFLSETSTKPMCREHGLPALYTERGKAG